MDNKKLKKLMTRVAKGELTMKEVDRLIKPKKVAQDKPEDEIEGKKGCGAGLDGTHYCGEDAGGYTFLCDKCEEKPKKKTQTRKLNHTGGKKNSK